VGAFLKGAIPFGRIAEVVREAMDTVEARPARELADIESAEAAALEFVAEALAGAGGPR
jgi:hypothetical protein